MCGRPSEEAAHQVVNMFKSSSGAVSAKHASRAVVMLHGGDCSLLPFAHMTEPDASACIGAPGFRPAPPVRDASACIRRHQAFALAPVRETLPHI